MIWNFVLRFQIIKSVIENEITFVENVKNLIYKILN